ncbi:TonB-dependent receptor [Joostella sp.]|uniref:TonB-dependent receptor n=1 Tax=Joostella sp. TaxID=2231138 RepID=UPI003A8F6397
MFVNKGFLLVLFLMSGFFVFAQNGALKGNIKHEDNTVASGVYLILKGNGIQKDAATNSKGNYIFKEISYGDYTLEIHSIDAKTKILDVFVNSEVKELDINLESSDMHELDEVTIQSKTKKEKIEEKGFAVDVIETKDVVMQSIQVNELLDRTAGVRVRKSGGLGSQTNYILNGMSGNSVRVFIDGIPVRNYGPSFSLNSIPTSMIKRIEVYKGVVPPELSDDAMGGAINIILNKSFKNKLTASVSAGSFGTYLGDINGSYRNDKTGFTARGSAFINYAENNYEVYGDQVAVTLAPGTPEVPIVAERFHDRYRSQSVKVDVGYTNVNWADKFMIGGLFSNMDNQIQTGATMEIVYGNRFTEQNTKMFNLDYAKKDIVKNLDLSAFASFSELNRKTVDTIATQYSWLGHPTSYYNDPDVWASGAEAGEPTLQEDIDQTINTRVNVVYHINDKNQLQFNQLLNTFTRDSDDPALPAIENAMQEERKYIKNILSFSYENLAFDERLSTTLFAKSYNMDRTAKIRTRTGNTANSTIEIEESNVKSNDIGFGAAISFALTEKIAVFGTAEKAIRLPGAGEVFGNVANNVNAAFNLDPERSNNYNLGFSYNNINYKKHTFGFTANGFIRDTEDLIIQLPTGNDEEFFLNSNVGKVYTEGFDFELNYNFNKMVSFNANTSFFNARDYSVTYDVDGNPITPTYERLPNTPYFTMNYNLRFDRKDIIQKGASFSFYTNVLYVDEFFRESTSLGGNGKIVIPTQVSTDLGLAYTFPTNKLTLSFDIKNLFDRQLFDNYALQKPGRGYYGKLTYSIL